MAALAIINACRNSWNKYQYRRTVTLCQRNREQMKRVAAEAMEEYIDYFTEPIWEKDEEGNEDID